MKICIVCKSKKINLFLKINELKYWKCLICDAKFLDRNNYVNYNQEKKHYLKHNNSIDDINYRNFLLRLIKPLREQISFNDYGLDYGCGYAPALADILKKEGLNVDIYDPFFFPNENLFLRKYKFITCSEVVEHFFNPHNEFIKINSILDNNSWLAIMTSFMSCDSLFKDWHYRRDPTHVVFYNERTFEIIANQHNWKFSFPCENVVLFNKN